MSIFADATSISFIDAHPELVSIGLIDETGHTFYGEFREADKHTDTDTLKIVEGLKYKDFNFNGSHYPHYMISKTDTSGDNYSFAIKGYKHQIFFELNAWMARIHTSHKYKYYVSPDTLGWFGVIMNNYSEHSHIISAYMRMETYRPVDTGSLSIKLGLDDITIEKPALGGEALQNAMYMQKVYKLIELSGVTLKQYHSVYYKH